MSKCNNDAYKFNKIKWKNEKAELRGTKNKKAALK